VDSDKEREIIRARWEAKQNHGYQEVRHTDAWSKAERETRVRNHNNRWIRVPILCGGTSED